MQKTLPNLCFPQMPSDKTRTGALCHQFFNSNCHDNRLFFAILLTGFHELLQLGELVWTDAKALQDYCKVILHHTAALHQNSFELLLPGHKGDQFFKGNQVIIQQTNTDDDPYNVSSSPTLPVMISCFLAVPSYGCALTDQSLLADGS